MNEAAQELDWKCEIHVEEDENTVAVRVPTEMTDLVAETTFSFYEKLASTMGGEVMRSLTFDFQVLE